MKASARDAKASDPALVPDRSGDSDSGAGQPSGVLLPLGGLSVGSAVRRAHVEADADPLGGTAIPQSVLGALRRNQGSGEPLPGDLSASAGEALGRDLSPVRVHADAEAATLTRSVQAVAFTHGHDIYFSAGSYRPDQPDGQRLIAHELGHIGQPESGSGGTIGRADDPAEAAADRAADGVLSALRRQAARVEPASHPVAERDSHQHPGCPHPPELRRLPRPAGPVRRMKLNENGSYAVFKGDHDTADRAAFATWVGQLQAANNTVTLKALLVALHRSVFDPADHETLAMSLVQRALDKLAPDAVAPVDDTRPALANLPRDEWWKLFIEGDKHDVTKTDDENAMRFDSDQSPGYYAAMSRAFETYVANSDGHELSFGDYDAMHQAVTRDTLSKGANGAFRPVPHKLSAQDIQFPMTHGEFPNPKALAELRAEGMLGLDETGMSAIGIFPDDPDRDAQVRGVNDVVAEGHEAGRFSSTVGRAPAMWLSLREIYKGQGPLTDFSSSLRVARVRADNSMQLLVTTNREESAANAEVSTLFREYYTEIRTVAGSEASELAKRRATLGAVARLVRALHVGHYFHDANGRLNTMVLLNRLLVDCGFPPVLMNRTDIFGGAFSEKELVAAIETGFRAFRTHVQLAHLDLGHLVVLHVPEEDAGSDDDVPPLESVKVDDKAKDEALV